MISNINSYPPKKKSEEPLVEEEEEVDSTKGEIQGERETSSMDRRDEFTFFVQNMLKGMQYISENIIWLGKETREFLDK